MAGIVPALEPGDPGHALGQQIDDLALALIAPLGADHDDEAAHGGAQARTSQTTATPAIMLAAPAMRSAASFIAASRSNTRRTPPGLANGRMPSITSMRPTAAARSGHAMCMEGSLPAWLFQVLEEFAL